MKCKISIVFFALLFGLFSCTSYKTQYVGFRPAAEYPNNVNAGGVTVGAEAFAEQATAKEAFGFDIKKAGLLPVQVVMDNRSGGKVQVVLEQTFLVDNNNRYWNLITNRAAVERVTKATHRAETIFAGAAKGAGWGAATGAVLGAAFGVLTGESVAEAAGKRGRLLAQLVELFTAARKRGRSQAVANHIR